MTLFEKRVFVDVIKFLTWDHSGFRGNQNPFLYGHPAHLPGFWHPKSARPWNPALTPSVISTDSNAPCQVTPKCKHPFSPPKSWHTYTELTHHVDGFLIPRGLWPLAPCLTLPFRLRHSMSEPSLPKRTPPQIVHAMGCRPVWCPPHPAWALALASGCSSMRTLSSPACSQRYCTITAPLTGTDIYLDQSHLMTLGLNFEGREDMGRDKEEGEFISPLEIKTLPEIQFVILR